jgi:hypothetical protein
MRNIKLYYHFFIPPDHRSASWHWWVDQQLGMIKRVGLADVAEVNMCITMPRFWTEMFGITIYTHSVQNPIDFEAKVREYISLRYPFVNIRDVRDVIEPNIYEGQTLQLLHEEAKNSNHDICYIQNKGAISGFTPHIANWRDLLNHYIINDWTYCVKKLEEYDLVGIADRNCSNIMLSGNFWWTRSEHVQKLPNPIESQIYMDDMNFHPYGSSYRYAFEHWIAKGNPHLFHIVQTHVDHYSEYCFLEDFLALQHKIRL